MNEYKNIEVDGYVGTYIMDERFALALVRAMSEEFNWATCVITQNDMFDEIQSRTLEPFDRDVAHEIAGQVRDTYSWPDDVSHVMMNEGLDCLRDIITSCLVES